MTIRTSCVVIFHTWCFLFFIHAYMTTRQTIKRFLEPMKVYQIRYIPFLTIWVIWSVVAFLMWFMTKYIIDAIVVGSYDLVLYWSISLWLTYTAQVAIGMYLGRERSKLYQDTNRDLQQKYMTQFYCSDNSIVEIIWSSRIQSILRSWISSRTNLLWVMVNNGIDFVLNLVFWVWILFYYSRILALWLIIIGLVIVCISKFAEKWSKQARKDKKENDTELDRQIAKWTSSKFETILQDQIVWEVKKLWFLWDIKTKLTLIIRQRRLIYHRLPRFIMQMVEVIVYVYIWYQVIDGRLTIWDLTFVIMVLKRSQDYFKMFGEFNQQFSEDSIHLWKLWDTFDNFTSILGYSTWLTFKPKKWEINIKNLEYWYTNWAQVFSNFSFSISGWSRIALVWPSGWGKTTLMKLISWYLHPQSWQILIDSQVLPTPQNVELWNHISLQSYYPHIWYLTQEPSVFDGTVWENLTYGISADAIIDTDKQLEQEINHIIKLARCEFIYEFKNWLQTEIGEKGVRLSWWQRQRLAIAKIMLKWPDIILLDEPTSALDSENEELVTQALNELFRGKTVIVIAHRLQTVKHSDQILYIDGGQVVESWTHQELLAMKWKYYKMVELQSWF